MADTYYKIGTDVFADNGSMTRKLELPEFQKLGLNFDLLKEGAGNATGLPGAQDTETKAFVAGGGVLGQANAAQKAGFTPVTLPVKTDVPASYLGENITQKDLFNEWQKNTANQQAQYDSQLASQKAIFDQTMAKMTLTPEEKMAQERILGLDQLQTQAMQQVQDRALSGRGTRAALQGEIQAIASGDTRESLVNLRQQTFETQRLNLLTNQRQQELEVLKAQLDQGNINTQNLFKYQELNQQMQNDYLDRVQQLGTDARTTLGTILDRFQGLTLDNLSPENLAQITQLAQQAGIPIDILRDGMKTVADQIKAEQDLKNYQAQTARINAEPSPTVPSNDTQVDINGTPIAANGKPLTAAQLTAKGYYDRTVESDKIITEIGSQFTGLVSYISQYAPNILKTADRQRYEQAQLDFVNAVLRPESGAAISASEFESAQKQYFPQPGDSASVIEQKSKNRQTKINSLRLQAGLSTSTNSQEDLRNKYNY